MVTKFNATEIKNKIPDATTLNFTPEFNTVKKLSFDARMKGAVKSLATEHETKNAFNLGDKNIEKI